VSCSATPALSPIGALRLYLTTQQPSRNKWRSTAGIHNTVANGRFFPGNLNRIVGAFTLCHPEDRALAILDADGISRRRLSLIRLYKRVLKTRFHSVRRKSGLMSGGRMQVTSGTDPAPHRQPSFRKKPTGLSRAGFFQNNDCSPSTSYAFHL
jgi:hypothetical protein